jgi:methyl acetate hydrolase
MNETEHRADTVLSEAVDSGRLSNVVAMAASADEVTYSGAYGLIDSVRSIESDSIFRIASMTKAITSVAAMQLVEEGILELDEPVYNHLPQIRDLGVVNDISEHSNELILSKQQTPITLRQLLTHTAGFGYTFFDPLLSKAAQKELIPEPTADQPPFATTPLRYQPGTRWLYGTNTEWLGVLIEQVRGQGLDQVFQDRIFGPLGMADTHFQISAGSVDRVVHPRRRNVDGSLYLEELTLEEPDFFNGGGGLFSTGPDYIRFLRALLSKGELDGARILSPATVGIMAASHTGDKDIGPLASQDPSFSNHVDLYPGMNNGFGLGFFVHGEPVTGGRTAGSLFWAGIMNTYFWVDFTQGVCGVFLTQVLPFYDKDALDTLGYFEQAIYHGND